MDALDRLPRLDFLPVPPPANPSPLDPATTTIPSVDFAQAFALAPIDVTALVPTAETTAAVPVAAIVVPVTTGDAKPEVPFDPAAALTALFQSIAVPVAIAPNTTAPAPTGEPQPEPTVTLAIPASPAPPTATLPAVVATPIPVGLLQGLGVEPPPQNPVPVKPAATPQNDGVPLAPTFVVNTWPVVTTLIPQQPSLPTPSVSVTPVIETADDSSTPVSEPPKDSGDTAVVPPVVVVPSFVALTVPPPRPVPAVRVTPPAPTTSAQPTLPQPLATTVTDVAPTPVRPAASSIVPSTPLSNTAPVAAQTVIKPARPSNVPAQVNRSVETPTTASQPILPQPVATTVTNVAPTPVRSAAPVITPSPTVPNTAPIVPQPVINTAASSTVAPRFNRSVDVPTPTTPLPQSPVAPVSNRVTQPSPQPVINAVGTVPLQAPVVTTPAPQPTAAVRPQPVTSRPVPSSNAAAPVVANVQPAPVSFRPIEAPTVPQPSAVFRPVTTPTVSADAPVTDTAPTEATPSPTAVATSVLPPVTPPPLSSATPVPPAAPNRAAPAPPVVAVPAPVPVTSVAETVPPADVVAPAVTQTVAPTERAAPSPTNKTPPVTAVAETAPAAEIPAATTTVTAPKDRTVTDSRHSLPEPRADEPVRSQDDATPLTATAPVHRTAETYVPAVPALDFGDPVPLHESHHLVQRLGDAIGLAQESGQHLSIRVTPPQFGPIVVNVQMHEGMVSARVETHSAVAQQMLTEHLPQLHESLSARGAMIDRIEVIPVENRSSERSQRVESITPEGSSNGGMSSETPGRQGYDPQDGSRRRMPRPLPVKPVAAEPAAVESVAGSRPLQLRELNVRV